MVIAGHAAGDSHAPELLPGHNAYPGPDTEHQGAVVCPRGQCFQEVPLPAEGRAAAQPPPGPGRRSAPREEEEEARGRGRCLPGSCRFLEGTEASLAMRFINISVI